MMIPRSAEGSGGADGIVLPLEVVGGGVYDMWVIFFIVAGYGLIMVSDRAYTIEVSVGVDGQSVYLQVDTGSSDLVSCDKHLRSSASKYVFPQWIASTSCSSSLCGQTDGRLYDPSRSSTPTGEHFDIEYLQGKVSGPVVWDKFDVAGYSLDSQALAAADRITSEPLSPTLSGILGLALPLNSVIAELIPPVTSNSPDGAAWASNLFSITPQSSAPSARFLSLLLSRPGSDAVPAQLGIGRHPSFVTDPSKVQYAALQSESEGTLFWKVSVRAITVWVGGEQRPVQIGRSINGAPFPSAVLDTGVPLILTTSAVANAIYGAIGIGPGSDGQYYVPCTTPLNLTITLDDRTPIPLHPLDLTAQPASTSTTASSCIGLIQSADSILAQPTSPSDLILGVPFLRNTYTVLAYEPPTDSGTFNASTSASDIKPRLGLIGITDPTTALDEFNTVRLLNRPISPSSTSGSGSGGSSSSAADDGGGGGVGTTPGTHISVGIIVLVFSSASLRSVSPSLVYAGVSRAVGSGALRSSDRRRRRARTRMRLRPGKELYADEETMRSARWEPYMQDHGLVDLGLGLGSLKGLEVGEDGREDAEMGLGEDGWTDGDDTLVVGGGRVESEVVRPQERTGRGGPDECGGRGEGR
ncbi:hypothetical protein C0995_003074 [Termitomyces sp. Mi166|nr:hypothetical protein C0995_003074 [Termitomyces sp. Mi166\